MLSCASAGGKELPAPASRRSALLPELDVPAQDERWGTAGDMCRLAADAEWNPYYGDRKTQVPRPGVEELSSCQTCAAGEHVANTTS
jgi:hypothetical protein